jgi:hypothetical protein
MFWTAWQMRWWWRLGWPGHASHKPARQMSGEAAMLLPAHLQHRLVQLRAVGHLQAQRVARAACQASFQPASVWRTKLAWLHSTHHDTPSTADAGVRCGIAA